jgi:hypothetical protein
MNRYAELFILLLGAVAFVGILVNLLAFYGIIK